MCEERLDRVTVRGGLASVSWPWVGAVALVVALVVLGWMRWSDRPQSVTVLPTATPMATVTPTTAPTVTPTSNPTATPSPVASPTPIIHVVQSGETISYIASYYGTSPASIMEANGLDETSARLLHPQQELLIPSTGPVGGPMPPLPGEMAQPPQMIYEVKTGETLISIAYQYSTTVEAIMAANNMDSPDLIYVGQELVVPLMPPTATPTLTPMPTPTPTPGPPYSAPQLLSPADGALFEGKDTLVVLTWTSVDILGENQAYLVELEVPALVHPLTYATQATSWRLPSDVWRAGQPQSLVWRVTVVQQENMGSEEPPEWTPRSLPSETRRFVWR